MTCEYHEWPMDPDRPGWHLGPEDPEGLEGRTRVPCGMPETRGEPTETPGVSLTVVDASCDCDNCVSRTTERYDVPGGCGNCGARFTVRNRKGDKAPLSVECPNCEVTAYGWRVFEEARNA